MTAQTLERGIVLLRILANGGPDGRRLVDLQRDAGLSKPTVHRLLDTLRRHGLVEQAAATRRYRLGREVAVLGWSVAYQAYDIKEVCETAMTAIAEETGDTSFLSVRAGFESVCIDRQTGSYPVKAFTVNVGTRRPLGVGATGIALLASLDPAYLDQCYAAIEPALRNFPNITVRQVRDGVEEARRQGYAVSSGLVLKGVRGLACAIRDPAGRAVAAIGVAAVSDRLSEERIPEVCRILFANVKRIEGHLEAVRRPDAFVQKKPRARHE